MFYLQFVISPFNFQFYLFICLNFGFSFVSNRRGEVTEEYIVDMQSADINRFGEQSIVLQPLSNNTHIQKTKYYENEVSLYASCGMWSIFWLFA